MTIYPERSVMDRIFASLRAILDENVTSLSVIPLFDDERSGEEPP